jgi:hypothetical protein
MRLRVKVTPRASRNEITGLRDGVLSVRISSPPVDGAANDELVRLLSKALGMRRADMRLVSGQSSRHKVLEIDADEPAVIKELRRLHGERK